MKRKFYSAIVIVYSIICIYIMTSYKMPNKNVNGNISKVSKHQEQVVKDKEKSIKTNSNNIDENNGDVNDVTEYQLDGNSGINIDEYKKNKSLEVMRRAMDEAYRTKYEDSGIDKIEGEFDSYNKEQKEKNQVIKVPIDEIVSCLSLSEKGKLLTISKRLSNEDYDKFNEYLSYKNQKIGVRKAIEILEEKLSDQEVDRIKEILAKYIDMYTVEEDRWSKLFININYINWINREENYKNRRNMKINLKYSWIWGWKKLNKIVY